MTLISYDLSMIRETETVKTGFSLKMYLYFLFTIQIYHNIDKNKLYMDTFTFLVYSHTNSFKFLMSCKPSLENLHLLLFLIPHVFKHFCFLPNSTIHTL